MSASDSSTTAVLAPAHPIVEGRSAEELDRQIQQLLERGCRALFLNLAAVPYMDSSGLGAVARGHTSACKRGGTLKLVAPSARVRTLLTMSRLDTVIEVFDSLDALPAVPPKLA